MPISETSTEPVNPLTGDLTTVAVVYSTGTSVERADVQARIVKPGLAITPRDPSKDKPGRPRFTLTHVRSGLGVRVEMCGVHVQEVAALAAGYPIDWTLDTTEVIAAIKATDLMEKTATSRCWDSYCDGDGPKPPSWGVYCGTCHWEWEGEESEGPLDAKEAKQVARDHECDPEVTIQAPGTKKWHDPFVVNDDGTVRGLSPRDTRPYEQGGGGR